MKKTLVLFILLTLAFASCAAEPPKGGGDDTTTGTPVIDNYPLDMDNELVELDLFDWYSAWANWTEDERVTQGIVNPDTVSHGYPREHLPLYRIDSVDALECFIEDYGDVFSMTYKYDEAEGFADATIHCDIDFFEEKLLLVAYMEAPSGSFRYGARRMTLEDGKLTLEIEQTNDPEAHTDDMAGWLVTAEVLRTAVTNCTSFDAVYVGVKGREELPQGINNSDLSQPPILSVITPDGSIKASMGTSSWFYPVEDGLEGATCYDSSHPMSEGFIDVMPRLSNDDYYDITGGVEVKLSFDFYRVPDTVTVRRWSIELLGQDGIDGFSESVELFDKTLFRINQTGTFIYEVTAIWNTSSDGVGGNVTYVFSIGAKK